MLSKLQKLAINWLPFLEKHLWLYPEKLDSEDCYVYGTGYESWGVWAHLNGSLYLAETLSWEDSFFTQTDSKFKSFEDRKKIAVGMFRYALGYHTTGDFSGAGGTRWGGEPKDALSKEGYNNWHSPLWVAFLAEVFFTLEKYLPDNLKERFLNVILHDANVQINLSEDNFDGEADEINKATHPESNAWKATLLLLARQFFPHHENISRWHNLEKRLWISSFATPNDSNNEEKIGNHAIKDLAIGNHITNSYNIVHHGFLHPCYMIFPLLSRLQAARFSQKLGIDFPEEAAFRENLVLSKLMPFFIGGRVIYPAGQDWPRWAYGQMYLLPILIHRHHNLGQDYSAEINNLIQTRETDRLDSKDNSFILHRFGQLLEENAWHAHRFESDAAASLIQAIQILKQPSQQLHISKDMASNICFEPLAKTVYLKRADSFFSISARAYEKPGQFTVGQLTVVSQKHPHLLEWRRNGCPQAWRLHGSAEVRKDSIENDRLKTLGESSIAGYFELTHIKEPYKSPSLKMTVNAGVLPNENTMLVRQKATSTCFTSLKRLQLHVWRFTQSPHNQWKRKITFEQGEKTILANETIDQEINSNWICLDDHFYLTLPKGQPLQSWHITQGQHHEDKTGITWFEVFVNVPVKEESRIPPNQLLADCSLIVSLENKPKSSQTTQNNHSAIFHINEKEKWELTETPDLKPHY